MIIVRRQPDGSYQPVNGHMRLRAALAAHGQAEVIDTQAGVTLTVHKVGDQLLVLNEDAQANLEDLAAAAINRAKH